MTPVPIFYLTCTSISHWSLLFGLWTLVLYIQSKGPNNNKKRGALDINCAQLLFTSQTTLFPGQYMFKT